jgi:predicted ATP-binding protein involved in virulence
MSKETTGLNLYLKKLILDDFRGFDHLEIDFDEKLSVFIAENGGGKTTILDAVAACLQVYLFHLLKANFIVLPKLSDKNIRYGTSFLKLQLDIHTIFTYLEVEEKDEKDNAAENEVVIQEFDNITTDKSLIINASAKKTTLSIDGYEASAENVFDFKEHFERAHQDNKDSLPIMAYYGSSYLDVDYKYTNHHSEDTLYDIYEQALEPNRFSFQSFVEWFDGAYKHYLSERAQASITEKTLPLQKVQEAVGLMLNEMETSVKTAPTMFKNLRMQYLRSGKGIMVIDKLKLISEDGKTPEYDVLDIMQLSAGEKMLFALVTDMAKRLIGANPALENPLEGQGIVLIDEIDIHLHPKWQRTVLRKLRKIFPNVQFVVTTHSPFVISSVAAQHLRRQPFFGTEQDVHLHTQGLEPNRILKEIMDTPLRDADTLEIMEAIQQLLKRDSTNPMIQTLINRLNDRLGKEDPFMMRIQHELFLLRRKKIA